MSEVASAIANAEFPIKLQGLFKPSRYKVAYGGRGGAKSWGIARALLIKGAKDSLRILCAREFQTSIKDSVHKLLCDQIESLGLLGFYEITQNSIRGKNGTEFSFVGLKNNVANIKSYEGVDICWVEEAQVVSKKSWDVLIPTIRKPNSEIWVSFNPQLESDETYRRFVTQPPPDCASVELNYHDNQFFPEVLEKERQHAQKTMQADEYAHIWEGKCMPAVEGAIYFDQMSQAGSRIANIPHDAMLKTHAIFDLGFNDSMAIILAQRVSSEVRIIHYIEDEQRTLADYSADLKALRLDGQPVDWGHVYLPHDGFAKRHQTGKMDADVMSKLGWHVRKTPNIDVESGIKRAREVFPRIYFNKERAARLVECLKRYRRQINQTTNEPGNPLHDEFSHGADAFRYLCINADKLTNEARELPRIPYSTAGVV